MDLGKFDFKNVSTEKLAEALTAAKRLEAIQQAKDRLIPFTKLTMPDPEDMDDPDRSMYQEAAHHRLIAEGLERVERGECLRFALSIPPQFGKLCADSIPVLTTEGWTTHGDLRPGHMVFGPDGQPTRVVAISEEGEASLEVEFTDGAKIKVHPAHEWTVFQRHDKKVVTLETQDLAERALWQGVQKRRAAYQVSSVPRVEFSEKTFHVHPYVLGAWLGDGTSSAPCITHSAADLEVASAFDILGYESTVIHQHRDTGVLTTSFGGPRPGVSGKLWAGLKAIGVANDKHIPEAYKIGSVRQRLELLAGLIDTDGHAHVPTRRVAISNTNRRLVDDAADVIRSLGWRATISETAPAVSSSGIVGKKPTFQVTFSPDMAIPTCIPRKYIGDWKSMRRRRGVKAIHNVSPERGKCIQVERPDGLYLVGRELIPTHNSELASRRFLAWYRGRNPRKNVIFGTYSDTFAEEFGGEVREIMQSDAFRAVFPDVKLRTGSKAKDSLIVEQGGRMSFVGRGGAATGKSADLIVIDDPLKNAEEANSPTIVKQLHEWYRKVIYSRVRTTTAIVIIHTRWIEDDLIGRLCDPDHSERKNDYGESKSWTYINVPAVLYGGPVAEAMGVKLETPSDPRVIAAFGRSQASPDGKLGAPQPVPMASLWPEQFSLEHLASAKLLDANDFNALYMGRPTPETGDYFKAHWLVEHRNPDEYPSPERLNFYAASDHALTTKENRDATCMGAVGVDQHNHIWVMPELVWDRFETDRLVEEMIAIMKFRKPHLWWAESEHIEKAIGPFRRQEQLKHRAFTTVVPLTSSKDLLARARNVQGRMSLRSLHFPAWMPWWQEARAQLLKFPRATHDDFVSFLSLVGRGLDSMAPAARDMPADQVIKVGSLAWVKARHNMEQRRARMRKAAAGF